MCICIYTALTSLTKRDISRICMSSVDSLEATLQPSVSRRDLSRATAAYMKKCINVYISENIPNLGVNYTYN